MQEKFVVLEFFKNLSNGKFLEIGANDGVPDADDEPVWGLKEKGWSGVYCEPNPSSCARLIKNIGPNRSDIKIVNCAITLESSLKTFYSVTAKHGSTGTSSFNDKWINYLPKILRDRVDFVRPIIINTITFSQLIDYVGNDFDFVSIDVETTAEENDKFIQNIDFSILDKCKMIMIESITESSIKYIESFGFKLYYSDNYKNSDFNHFFIRFIPE
jgi:FkbM family methyltransferase